jgi:HK97 gp10 family phage protein
MPLETEGLDALRNDIARMAGVMDADGAGSATAKKILLAGAEPIHQQMKANASKDPQIITGALHRSIQIGSVRKRKYSGKSVTIGVHHSAEGAYYANPVEFGHGGHAPAPAHPFVRPAFDTRADEAYNEMKRVLRDELKNK